MALHRSLLALRLPAPIRTQLRRRWRTACPALLASLTLCASPARALETIQMQLPLLQTTFTLKVSELGNRDRLYASNSDLAQLDRATGGRLWRRLNQLVNAPLPLPARRLVDNAVGTPLFEQVMLLTSALVEVKDLPPDRDGSQLAAALARIPADQPITLLALLQAIPGQTASIDLEEAVLSLQRLTRQQRLGEQIVQQLQPVSSDPTLAAAGPMSSQSRSVTIPVSHRPAPLQLQVVTPSQGGNGRLVLISHGLWDSPTRFLGWAEALASRGYAVILPYHPGSDQQQQQAMLAGKAAPPPPDELRKRPLDVSAAIDAVRTGAIPGLQGVASDRVVVIGHSWGATTALQLGGARPSSTRLRTRCDNFSDPDRNLSWVLQCSFLQSADQAALADPRVVAVAAVSPPLNLVFDLGAAASMQARGLLVSGTRDWVVPSGPEAIDRFGRIRDRGHQLVLVKGGDHFNLRGPVGTDTAPLSPLLVRWTDAAFAAGDSVRPRVGASPLIQPLGWGNGELPMVEATAAVP
ncbi:MAG: alpha/beta hydrolase family protein [Cyanobium sp.]